MIRTFVTSDTHGCNKQLRKALKLAEFDYNNDLLIHLGDCTDRGIDSFGVIETLLKIKNLISIRGNHDEWMLQYINTGRHPSMNGNGVYSTFESYMENKKDEGLIPRRHEDFFRNQRLFYVDNQGRLFVHAGYDPMEKIEHQHSTTLVWDRNLVNRLAEELLNTHKVDNYPDVNYFTRVFVGHTPTLAFKKKVEKLSHEWLPGGIPYDKPMYMGQLVDIDTGACFGGKLSLIDITDDNNHILYQT